MTPTESGRIHVHGCRKKPAITLFLPDAPNPAESEQFRRELIYALRNLPQEKRIVINESFVISVRDGGWWPRSGERLTRSMLETMIEHLFPGQPRVVSRLLEEREAQEKWRPTVGAVASSICRGEILLQAESLVDRQWIRRLVKEAAGCEPNDRLLQLASEICSELRRQIWNNNLDTAAMNDLQNATDPDTIERWAKKRMFGTLKISGTRNPQSPFSLLQNEFMQLIQQCYRGEPLRSIGDFIGHQIARGKTGKQSIQEIVTFSLRQANYPIAQLEVMLWRLAHWKVDQFPSQWQTECSVNDEELLVYLKQMQCEAFKLAKSGVPNSRAGSTE